ncbi:hypothetical protein [Nostoc sp. FACHB-888]|nr:hypothetical protein [Nostoc sp. FACHB-888]
MVIYNQIPMSAIALSAMALLVRAISFAAKNQLLLLRCLRRA